MKLLKFLLQRCRRMVVVSVITALLSGACNAGLIALINTAVNLPNRTTTLIFAGFIGLVLGKIITGLISQIWLIRFSQKAIAQLRLDLVERVLGVPLRRLEQIGSHRVMVALTDDVNSLTNALFSFPTLTVNVAILMGGSVYLAVLSWQLLVAMGVMIVFGAVSYRLFIRSGFRSLFQAREAEDRLYGCFRSLTEGIKELKLHRDRRGDFVNEGVKNSTHDFQKHTVAAETRFILAHNWSHLLFYVLVGMILFMLPSFEKVDIKTMTGYVLTVLYLMGPLAGVMSSMSVFSRAGVALGKIEALGMTLGAEAADVSAAPVKAQPAFEKLEMRNVTHTYRNEGSEDKFVIGPVNLTFEPGELVFLVGGNGSGKSSLAKIVTGLYPPEKGDIVLNGKPVTDANRDDYRQIFSTVFADFHLFENLLGLEGNVDVQAREYLSQLHLSHKVKITDGRLSTTALSSGQRKRLALLTAYLENRPFYVFDEWAADQDPLFKDIFYRELLPELKRRGKTALVITHDDKYFNLADRVLKLDYGQLVTMRPDEPITFSNTVPAFASRVPAVPERAHVAQA